MLTASTINKLKSKHGTLVLWSAAKVRLGQFNNLPTTLPREVTGGGRVKSQNDWMQKISFAMTLSL